MEEVFTFLRPDQIARVEDNLFSDGEAQLVTPPSSDASDPGYFFENSSEDIQQEVIDQYLKRKVKK